MIAYIDEYKDRRTVDGMRYGIEPICAELPIAPSTYYEMRARKADPGRLPAERNVTWRCGRAFGASGTRIARSTAPLGRCGGSFDARAPVWRGARWTG